MTAARGSVLVLSAATLWGLNGAVSKVVLQHGISSELLTQARVTGAFVGLLAVLLATRPAWLRATPREAATLVVFGAVGLNGVQLFYFLAIDRLPIGIAVLLEYLAPVLVALYVRVVLRRRLGRGLWAAIILVLAGLALMLDVLGGESGLSTAGLVFGFLAAACYALYILMAEHAMARRDPVATLCWGFGVSAAVWALAEPPWRFPFDRLGDSVSLGGRLSSLSAPEGLLVAWVVVMGTLIPFALLVSALHALPAARATLLSTWEPVAGAALAWAWLAERLSPLQVAGAALVLLGILVAEAVAAGRPVPSAMRDGTFTES